MLALILFSIAIICAIGWINRWVTTAALIKFMYDKKYTMPSVKELNECLLYTWRHLLHLDS